MRLSIPILFLTLVVNGPSAMAAPTIQREPNPIEMSPKDKSDPIYNSESKEQNWSLRLGLLGGSLHEANPENLYFYGLSYMFLKESLSSCWQIEGSLAQNNFLHIVVGKKIYFSLTQDTLPYYKFSVGDLIDSAEGLGSIFNLKKIQAIAAIGLDDVLPWDQPLHAEVGVGYALIGPQLEISLGFGF